MKAILTYHSIDESGSPISVSPGVFADQLKWLASGAARPSSLDEIQAGRVGSDDQVSVTFDDALLTSREPILALLRERIPVTVFVVTGRVGRNNEWSGRPEPGIPTIPLMGWDDLQRLRDAGARLAPHTRSHRSLPDLDEAARHAEMAGSSDDLHERLGVRSPHFAYPFGHVTSQVAADAGRHFTFGYTTGFAGLGKVDEPLQCPRLDMYYFQAGCRLDQWGSPAFDRHLRYVALKRAVRRWLPGR